MHSLTLITGATGGLGKALAAECASRGWDLYLTDISEERLSLLAAGLERTYRIQAHHSACDLISGPSRAALIDAISRAGFRFRGLINVAGLDHEGYFMDREAEDISTIIRLNIEATLLMTHALLPLRDHALPFRIVNVSSLGAYFAMPIKATYAASKRFLLDFSLALGNEMRDENVTVTVLCPAGLPTTAQTIQAIEAQGLMGQLTTMNIGSVARETIDAALRGRGLVIPGWLNRMLLFLSAFVPTSSVVATLGDRWRMAHERREPYGH